MNEPQTLAQRLAQGKIPAPEAERYAMMLAEALRRIHDAGHVHGGVSPASIVLTGSSLELLPAANTTGTITPYTAPELLQGRPAEPGSDVFAFGAIVYEMFSGRHAFEGDGAAALSTAINTSVPPSCGSPAMDRLLSNCLAKDPTARWQRMNKILMELKLRSVLARRVETPAAVRRDQDAAGLRAEMQQLEGRVTARLQACENSVAEVHDAATELRGQLAAVNAQFGAAGEGQMAIFEGLLETAEARIAEPLGRDIEAAGERVGRLEQGLEATEARIAERVGRDIKAAGERVGRLEQGLEAAEARITERVGRDIEAAGERVGRLEQGLEAAREHTTTLHESVSEDFLAFEQGLKSHAVAIESVRTAMSQTDDLVERVVEALESLQSVVLEPREDPGAAMN